MKFSEILYTSAFSKVFGSDCGSLVLKRSKRSLASEIKLLSKLEACPNTPNLIEVIDDKSIILERLEVCDDVQAAGTDSLLNGSNTRSSIYSP